MKNLLAMMLAGIMSIALLTGCGSKSVKLDLMDYVEVSFTGYEGGGKAVLSMDSVQLEKDMVGDTDGNITSEELNKMLSMVDFEMSVKYTADPTEELSNGDKVTVTATYNEDLAKSYGLKITSVSKTYTVEGLEEVELVDPFDEEYFNGDMLFVYFYGWNGYGQVGIYNGYSSAGYSEPYHYLTYSFDKDWELSNGEVITIYAGIGERYANKQLGFELSRTEMTIVVEGLQE